VVAGRWRTELIGDGGEGGGGGMPSIELDQAIYMPLVSRMITRRRR